MKECMSNKKICTGVDFPDLEIDSTAEIDAFVKFIGVCKVGKNVKIIGNSVIENSIIQDNCIIKSSYIEGSKIMQGVLVGPFAHIRPNCVIDSNAKIGNFVEIKNSKIGQGSKVSHLAYVGDAEVGKNCNIGCGVIFANYNGKIKQKIVVEDNCFIGSNSNLIAPLYIAKNSYICAGTTLTKNTNPNDFVIARCRETIKCGKAASYLKEEV